MAEEPRSQELTGLDEGFRVRHIATYPIITCLESDDPDEVFARDDLKDLDQIPARKGEKIVGILERSNPNRLRPIDESVLVSADALLSNFIHTAREESYRLVVEGTQITGIVTWSDLLKLPVLVLAYSQLAELELAINGAIRKTYGDSDRWIKELSKKDQSAIENTRHKLQKRNLLLAPVEIADIAHKAKVVQTLLRAKNFHAELDRVVRLRNDTAHVKSFAESSADLRNFVHRLETAEAWITALKKTVEPTSKSHAATA